MSESDVNAILVAFTDFKATVTTKLDTIAGDNARGEKVHDDHESRIRSLERRVLLWTGFAAAGGGSIGAAAVKVLGG